MQGTGAPSGFDNNRSELLAYIDISLPGTGVHISFSLKGCLAPQLLSCKVPERFQIARRWWQALQLRRFIHEGQCKSRKEAVILCLGPFMPFPTERSEVADNTYLDHRSSAGRFPVLMLTKLKRLLTPSFAGDGICNPSALKCVTQICRQLRGSSVWPKTPISIADSSSE